MKRLLTATVVLAGAVSLFAGEFKAGFARTDITPPLGVYMPGYYQARHAKEILDPLSVNCLAFNDGNKTALIMQFDTEALSDSVADGMRDAIVKATGVDRNAILLHASHTHDGGHLAAKASQGASAGNNVEPLTDLYIRMSTTRAADAAVEAIRDLKPATLAYQRTEAKRISFGRRYLMKSGKVQTNPGTNNPDIVGPAGNPPDESVQVLRIDRTGGKPICLINFQTHPDVVGGETITTDWPGLTRTVFEAATLGKTHCLVINGTQGDLNHCNVQPRPGEMNGLKRDFDAVDRGYDHAWHMANVLAAAALSKWMKCIPLEAGEVKYMTSTIRVPAQKAKDSDEKNLAWANDVWTLHEKAKADGVVATDKDYVTVKYGWKDMELTTEVARAGRIRRMADHADYHDLPIYAVAIGNSVAFGGFPGEPFNDIGVAIRKGSPFKLTILSCLTNGSRGYFPFSSSFKEDGYEAATSPFGPTVADDLIKGQLKLLGELAK
jgi:hypothetical protein